MMVREMVVEQVPAVLAESTLLSATTENNNPDEAYTVLMRLAAL